MNEVDAPRASVTGAPSAPASSRVWWLIIAVLVLLGAASVGVAWRTQQRVHELEQELVRRQQDSQGQATEARTLARQAQENARDAVTKASLLEARVAEVALQRGQLEDLIQSLSRSRDENLLVDIEAAVRVAQQQSAITGTVAPLVTTLQQADERLARYDQPRLEGVRRAIARDLDRVRAVGVADISSLNIRLDEAVRMVDDLPLLAQPERRAAAGGKGDAPPASMVTPARWSEPSGWWPALAQRAEAWWAAVWDEVRSLVRVTRVDHPEAMMLAPEHAFFVRENLKLRLLNARLAVLSRQFDAAQADLTAVRTTLERYFDRSSRKVGVAIDLVKQVATQARQVALPRPDETLAALSTAAAGR